MISYHKDSRYIGGLYDHGWRTAEGCGPIEIEPYVLGNTWSGIVWEPDHRLKENFKLSDWCVLDFETEEMSLEKALAEFCFYTHIIGTTRKHRLPDEEGKVLDRFRVAIPWRERITDCWQYEHNIKELQRKYKSDSSTTTGASYFFKCTEIVSLLPEGKCLPVAKAPPKPEPIILTKEQIAQNRKRFKGFDFLPKHLRAFLLEGRLFSDVPSRERCCFIAARSLMELGLTRQEILRALVGSPFKKGGFEDKEYIHAVDSAEKYFTEELSGND